MAQAMGAAVTRDEAEQRAQQVQSYETQGYAYALVSDVADLILAVHAEGRVEGAAQAAEIATLLALSDDDLFLATGESPSVARAELTGELQVLIGDNRD